MKLSFHGAAREVTGACYLLESKKSQILVDCGLFQGAKEWEDFNFQDFRFDPAKIDALFVTHGHLDHVGRIPKLFKGGFKGKIYSTPATKDLSRPILEDSLALAEKEGKSFFGRNDIESAFSSWSDAGYGQEVAIGDFKIIFHQAGHILGSASLEIFEGGRRIFFSGDIGNTPSVLLPPPEAVRGIEYLIIESAYGNKIHESSQERQLKLERAVEDVTGRGGVLMIPAFATERTQEILFLLNEMLHFKRIPEIPVFVDSPLAIKITEVFEKYPQLFRDEIKSLYIEHPNLFRFKKLNFTTTVEDSKKINDVPSPKVIIAGSGMMNGGRILHHARRYLSGKQNILLFVGFQTAGSLGRRLIDHEKNIRLFGEEIFVEAEIRQIQGFSAHADNPQLFSMAELNRDTLKKVFVVQGEEAQALHFSQEIKDRLGISAQAPGLFETFEI